jgi:cytochrome c biogenesis protein CcmG/thiol:disulfide interchange protein DsbE
MKTNFPRCRTLFFTSFAAIVLAANLTSCVHFDNKPMQLASDLRQRFFNREYKAGYETGRKAIALYPGDASIVAWFAANAARSDHSDEALATTEAMIGRNPSSGWAQFGKSAALLWDPDRGEEAVRAAAAAYALEPERADFIWGYSEALRLQRRFDDANALLEKHKTIVERSSHVLVIRGSIAFDQYMADSKRTKLRNSALEDFRAAERLDETVADAYFAHAWFLGFSGENDDTFILWQKAARISQSLSIRQSYWWSAYQRANVDRAESRRFILADMAQLLDSRPRDPDALLAAVNASQMLEDFAAAERYTNEILTLNIPGASLDEAKARSFNERVAKLGPRNSVNTAPVEDERQLESEIVEFISAPGVNRDAAMSAGQVLLQLVERSSEPSSGSLQALIQFFAKYGDEQSFLAYVLIPRLMADRSLELDQAERLVLQGKSSLERKVERAKNDTPRQQAKEVLGLAEENLGWIWFKQGKVEAAERQLALSAKSPPDSNPYVYSHLASVYLVSGKIETSMLYLERCFAAQWTLPNPCIADLAAYYRKKNGSSKGEEDWVARRVRELQGGKAAALAERYQRSAKKLKPFTLATLDGREVKSNDLRGKVLVVSFWGAWCGACMIELPELQEFAKRHESDADFVLLTINNDRNLDDARKAVKEKGLSLQIAIDQGYAEGAGVYAFPTTWIIGPEQDRRLELRGLTPNLRVELETMLAAVRKR